MSSWSVYTFVVTRRMRHPGMPQHAGITLRPVTRLAVPRGPTSRPVALFATGDQVICILPKPEALADASASASASVEKFSAAVAGTFSTGYSGIISHRTDRERLPPSGLG